MKYVLGFVFGTLIGAAVALMFAPYSGEDLRTNIKSQVDEQSAWMREQWQQKYQQLQKQVDKMSGDLQMLGKQNKEAKEETEPFASYDY